MSKKVVIAGGSGLIGSKLTDKLLKSGWEVVILTRGSNRVISDKHRFANWNVESKKLPEEELLSANAIINLAGRNLADKRLSGKFKNEVYKSRIDSTKLLVNFLNLSNSHCETFVNSSAIGYFGYHRGDEPLNEDADPGNGFMAELCIDWEQEAKKLEGIRTVIVRIGVVLDAEEGAFNKLKQPILLGLGSALASGRQFVSWIHIDDLVASIEYALNNEKIEGTLNATAPNPVRNKYLIGQMADSLNKAILVPKVPAFALRLMVGELSEALIGSLNVLPDQLQKHNFLFAYPEVENAIRNLNWGK